jgi:hypothetical protein
VAKASRDKGKRGELEIDHILSDRGIQFTRDLDGRRQIYGDFLLSGMALEVRRRESVSITRWSKDHEAEVPGHLTPAVAYRTNGEPWRVSLPLEDLLDLIEAAEA